MKKTTPPDNFDVEEPSPFDCSRDAGASGGCAQPFHPRSQGYITFTCLRETTYVRYTCVRAGSLGLKREFRKKQHGFVNRERLEYLILQLEERNVFCVTRKAIIIIIITISGIIIANNNVVIFKNLFTKGPFFNLLPPRGWAVPWRGAVRAGQNRSEPAGTSWSWPCPAGGSPHLSSQHPALCKAASSLRRWWKH